MRDEPLDALLPERFEPSDYNKLRLIEAQAKLAEIEALTPEDCAARAKAWFEDEREGRATYLREKVESNNRLHAMREAVASWDCKAEGLREFMLQQLGISIDDTSWAEDRVAEHVPLSGDEWRERELQKARRDIAYHADEWAKEVDRANERTAWLKALRDSLPPETTPGAKAAA